MTSFDDVLKQVGPFLKLALPPGKTIGGIDFGTPIQQALSDGTIDLRDLPVLVGLGTQIVLHEMTKAHAAAPPPTLPATAVPPPAPAAVIAVVPEGK